MYMQRPLLLQAQVQQQSGFRLDGMHHACVLVAAGCYS